jgi:hypothetical protein
VLTELLKEPVVLLEVQVTVPVGLKPETVAMHVADPVMCRGFGSQDTDVEDSRRCAVTTKIVVLLLGALKESPL